MALTVRTVDASAYPPAALEQRALRLIRNLAQESLKGMAITAAINPAELVTDQIQADYLALANALWEEANGLSIGFGISMLPLEQFMPLVQASIQSSLSTFVQSMTAIINKQADGSSVYGAYFFAPDYVPGTGVKPPDMYEVQYGDIRQVLTDLGGGGMIDAPLATGITGGVTFNDVLSANGIAVPDKIWLYGEYGRRTFNGHLQMDGLVFRDWNDEALNISPQDRWLRVDKYRPGDHWGCACVVVPYVPNFGEATPIRVSAFV